MTFLAHSIACDGFRCPEAVRSERGLLAAWDMALVAGWRSTGGLSTSYAERRHFCAEHADYADTKPANHVGRAETLLVIASMEDGSSFEEGAELVERIRAAMRGDAPYPVLITESGRSRLPWKVTGRTVKAALYLKAAGSAIDATT
jgi:hypothetical protein